MYAFSHYRPKDFLYRPKDFLLAVLEQPEFQLVTEVLAAAVPTFFFLLVLFLA
jgi:hypothetical protein